MTSIFYVTVTLLIKALVPGGILDYLGHILKWLLSRFLIGHTMDIKFESGEEWKGVWVSYIILLDHRVSLPIA